MRGCFGSKTVGVERVGKGLKISNILSTTLVSIDDAMLKFDASTNARLCTQSNFTGSANSTLLTLKASRMTSNFSAVNVMIVSGHNIFAYSTRSTYPCSSFANALNSSGFANFKMALVAPCLRLPHPPLRSPNITTANGSLSFFALASSSP